MECKACGNKLKYGEEFDEGVCFTCLDEAVTEELSNDQ
jgi:hypothetical protein